MRKKWIRLSAITGTALLAAFLSACSAQLPADAEMPKEVEEVNISIGSDYPVYSDIASMVQASDCIVIGQYQEFLSSWNMDRLPADPTQEDPTSYSEGRLYSFAVSQVLKGSNVPDEITINKAFSVQAYYPVNGANGQTQSLSYQLPSQYYVAPEYGTPYLLFLSYSHANDIYFAMGEPGEVIFQDDGTVEVRSNLFHPSPTQPARLEAQAESDTTVYQISIGGTDIGRYAEEDFLSGMTQKDLLAEIETCVAE